MSVPVFDRNELSINIKKSSFASPAKTRLELLSVEWQSRHPCSSRVSKGKIDFSNSAKSLSSSIHDQETGRNDSCRLKEDESGKELERGRMQMLAETASNRRIR